MIIEITRGHILLKINNKIINIQGEALIPTEGYPDFIVYSSSIKKWEPPFENEILDEDTKQNILKTLRNDAEEKKIKLEIE